MVMMMKGESESRSVVSDSLRFYGLYSPWNSPGQNTGMGSLSLLQGIFPIQGSNPGLLHCRQILYQLSHKGSPRILEWIAYPFSSDLPDPGIKPGSPSLQVDSLPTELSGKPQDHQQSPLLRISSSSPSFHPIPTHPHGPCTPVCMHTHTYTQTYDDTWSSPCLQWKLPYIKF